MNAEWPNITGYEVHFEIGRGGMGVVYRVRHRSSGSLMALKMLLGSRGASFTELARFRVEIAALGCLNHPNIVHTRDVGLYGGTPYLAMEFAERGSLKQAIANGRHTPRSAAELVRILASAMQHAHTRGMIHRDLKPANVLLMEDGTPKISDFGLVKFSSPFKEVHQQYSTIAPPLAFDALLLSFAGELRAQYTPATEAAGASPDEITRSIWEQCAARTGVLQDEVGLHAVREFLSRAGEPTLENMSGLDDLTRDGAIVGSPNYMAPEQALGDHAQIGPRTDVYALGGILYELLTGVPPFTAKTLAELLRQVQSAPPAAPRRLVPDVSKDIEAVCLKCLEKSPQDRYPSAAALADDLSRFLDGFAPHARGTSAVGTAFAGSSEMVDVEAVPSTQVEPIAASKHSTWSWWPIGRHRKTFQ